MRLVDSAYRRPLLLGLADGIISTVAPIFASAIASGDTSVAFRVGVAACVGAALSMGVSEAFSDEKDALMRGLWTGGGTFAGGFAHLIPFLIPSLQLALVVGGAVVVAELILMAYLKTLFFESVRLRDNVLQITAVGLTVFFIGIVVGDA